jgi:hypothetical protein
MGGNLPIFGKALIVAASDLALAGHDLHGLTPAETYPRNKQNGSTLRCHSPRAQGRRIAMRFLTLIPITDYILTGSFQLPN